MSEQSNPQAPLSRQKTKTEGFPSADSVTEEVADNTPLGIEREQDDESSADDVRTPYDPKAIRVDPRVYSVRQILDMVTDKELDLAPDFQRLEVWKPRQKSSLIESLLLRIPLPAFYFSSDDEGRLQVVDGVQRLTTIFKFVRQDAFQLTNLEYLGDVLGGKTFSGIENTIWSRRILNTQITAFVIDPQTPTRVKFDIFKRINTGGSPLTSQEIRHCMSRERSRNFLRKMAADDSFNVATNYAFTDHVRMADRELALRFIAFRRLGDIIDYQKYGGMDEFLTAINEQLDDNESFTDNDLAQLEASFSLAMRNAYTIFGHHAFRKWFENSEKIYPINRSLFDVWSVELSRYGVDDIAKKAEFLEHGARKLLTEDPDFIDAISTSTGSVSKVISRFRKVQTLLASAR